jgi:hypothetical protein
MSMNMTRTSVQDRELIATRVFDAPRETVYRTWTDPGHLSKWWGPKGFTITTHMIDVRTGGVWRYMMHGRRRRKIDTRASCRAFGGVIGRIMQAGRRAGFLLVEGSKSLSTYIVLIKQSLTRYRVDSVFF